MRLTIAAVVAFALGGCATWSTSDMQPSLAPSTAGPSASALAKRAPTTPRHVALFDGDIVERTDETIADISVAVNKTTIFHPDPTREMVAERLKEEAAKLGADAVITFAMARRGSVH